MAAVEAGPKMEKVPLQLYKFDAHQRDCASVWFPAAARAHVQCCVEVSLDPAAAAAQAFSYADADSG